MASWLRRIITATVLVWLCQPAFAQVATTTYAYTLNGTTPFTLPADSSRRTLQNWLKAGRFTLPPDDHDEFIPLPQVPLTVSYP